MADRALSRSGVFSDAADEKVERFSESVSVDDRLYAHDIAGSVAHAEMLCQQGLISSDELDQIICGLGQIKAEIESGRFAFQQRLEDVHMNVEQALIDRLGDVGRKLHTARSRNDQVATDLRLWVRDAVCEIDRLVAALQRAFVDRCDKDAGVILPGFTHMQRAQPVLAAHYWLAYCEKLHRDRGRIRDCLDRANVCPLGSAALAGTSLPVDRHAVSAKLGFAGPTDNSLDSSSDRDFVLEFVFALTMIAGHLSGWAEEWILWSTTEFGFLKLPQAYCTGSSIMPQKVNPDVLELTRGKTARVIGSLTTLLALVKGLPLAYNRDLQEDKPPLFDAFDTVKACLELAAPIVAESELNRPAIAARLEEGYLDATTLMEYLIRRGIPQRTGHQLVGALVRTAMDRGVPLAALPLQEFQSLHPDLDAGVYGVLGVQNVVNAFVSFGSTAPAQVDRQVARWREKLAQADA